MEATNKIAGYRAMIGKTKTDFAKILGISPSAYGVKERYKKFTDEEKVILVNFLKPYFNDLTIERLFF